MRPRRQAPAIRPTASGRSATNAAWGRLLDHVRTPLFRNAYALVANQGVNAALGVAFWVVAARIFPPDVVGQNAALLSTMTFVSLLSQLGMRNAFAWVLPSAGASGRRFVAIAYLTSAGLTLLLAPAMLVLLTPPELTSGVAGEPAFLAWFTVGTVLSSLFALQDGVLVGLRAATWVPVTNAAFGLLKVGLLPLLVGGAAVAIFAAWTLALIPLVIAVNAFIFMRLMPPGGDAEGRQPTLGRPRDVLRFITGDYVGTLMVQGTIRLIPILVLALLGSEANAYSFQAWTVALPLFLVAGSMTSSLTVESLTNPQLAAAYSRRMLLGLARVLVPASVLIAVAAPLILALFGPVYADRGTTLLRLLALATLPLTLNVWYYALCRIRGTVAPIVIGQGIVAVATLSVSALLLPVLGISATGVGWLFGQSLAALVVVARDVRWRPGSGVVLRPSGGLNGDPRR